MCDFLSKFLRSDPFSDKNRLVTEITLIIRTYYGHYPSTMVVEDIENGESVAVLEDMVELLASKLIESDNLKIKMR